MMKNIFSILAIAAMAFSTASCNKDDKAEEKRDYLTYEEQISYLDATGVTLLQQFEPKDFQKLADIVQELMNLKKTGVTFDEATQLILQQLVGAMTITEGSVTYMFFNTDYINGTLTIKDGVGSFTPGTGKRIVLVSSANNYSADITITNSTKPVRVSNMAQGTKLVPQNGDVIIYAPSAIDVVIKHNNDLYARAKFNLDYSKMGDDWTNIQTTDINFSVNGDLYVNGENSYRIRIDNFSQAGTAANVSITMYGTKGAFMASANGNMLFVQSGSTSTYAPIDLKVKFLDRCEGVFNGPYSVDVYMDNRSQAQMYVDLSTNTVTCIDGTKDTVENVFSSANFPLTIMSGGLKLIEMMTIFNFIEWPEISLL